MEREIPVELGRAIIGLNRTKKMIMNRRLNEMGIAGPPHMIIAAAKQHPGCNQDFVSEYFAIGKAAVARGAQRLEEMGLITRETSKEDRRQNKLFLTKEGEAAYELTADALREWENCLTEGMSAGELETAISLLTRMLDSARRHVAESQSSTEQ